MSRCTCRWKSCGVGSFTPSRAASAIVTRSAVVTPSFPHLWVTIAPLRGRGQVQQDGGGGENASEKERIVTPEHLAFLQQLFPSPGQRRSVHEAARALGLSSPQGIALARDLEAHGYILVGGGGFVGTTPKGAEALNRGSLE